MATVTYLRDRDLYAWEQEGMPVRYFRTSEEMREWFEDKQEIAFLRQALVEVLGGTR